MHPSSVPPGLCFSLHAPTAKFTLHDFKPDFLLTDKNPKSEANQRSAGARKLALDRYVWTTNDTIQVTHRCLADTARYLAG